MRVRVKKPCPILIQYEMISAQDYLPYLCVSGGYNQAKNHAVLRRIYKGNGSSMLFCGKAAPHEWIVSFTTHAIDGNTGLFNAKPHFISMKLSDKVMASVAIALASKIWLDDVKPDIDSMNMIAVSIDVVLRAKA